MENLNEIFLLIIGGGVIGWEIANSELSYSVKRQLQLHEPKPIIRLLSEIETYKKVLGVRLTSLLLPLLLVVIIMANVHRFFFKLLNCPYCTAFQLVFWLSIFVFSFPILNSILIGSTALLPTAVYNLIRSNS